MNSKVCVIPNCGEAIKPGSKLSVCHVCRSSLYSWNKRRPAEVLDRRLRLHKYDARMATIVDDSELEKRSRVVNITTARKRRHG